MKYYQTFILLFSCLTAYSQTVEQKAIKLHKEATYLVDNEYYDSAKTIFRKQIETLDSTKNFYLQGLGYRGLAYSMYYLNEYDELNLILNSYLQSLPNKVKDTSQIVSRLYTYLALSYYERGDYSNSYNVYKRAEELAERINASNKATIYGSLASVCLKRGDYKQAQSYAIKEYNYLKNNNGSPIDIYNSKFGILYTISEQDNPLLIIKQYHKLLEEGKMIENSSLKKEIYSSIYSSMGLDYIKLSNYDSAIIIFANLFSNSFQTQHCALCTGSIMESISDTDIKNIYIDQNIDIAKYVKIIEALNIINKEL